MVFKAQGKEAALRTKRLVLVACAASAIGLTGVGAPPAEAQSVGIEVNIPGGHFNLHVGDRPHLVAVPGVAAVSYAPRLAHNYFVYGGHYYLYHGDAWFFGQHHNGPWMRLHLHQVPRPILRVPVTYYKVRPKHWRKAGPPPWVHPDRRDRPDRDRDRPDRGGRHDRRARHDGPGRHR